MKKLEEILDEAKKREVSGDFFSASFFYKDALKLSQKHGDSEKIKLCKTKVIEMNKKSEKDFKEISTEINIPTKDIEKVIDSIIGLDLTTTLKNIGISHHLYPSVEQVKKQAQGNHSVFRALANSTTISDLGHIIKGGENVDRTDYFRTYEIHQGIAVQLVLVGLFKKIIVKQNMDKINLLKYFKDTKLFTEQQIEFMEIAIERYFSKDYTSAMHILVPQFESFFLHVSKALGIDTVSMHSGKGGSVSTETKTLSSTNLQSKEFKDVWGEDLCEQIDFILFEPLGYKLRHKVAHGEINTKECNFELTTLIIQLFLAICARIGIKES